MGSSLQGSDPQQRPGDYPPYRLRLYIAGPTTTSTRALVNIRKICEAHLKGLYELEVVDLSVDARQAEKDRIISLPTLVKVSPGTPKRVVGDLSDIHKVLSGLDITNSTTTYSSSDDTE